MAIKAVFARNLRALCKARGGSVNAVCRSIGIGRTQMDRYLNGDHLPNELNLKKISDFFEIEDTALFSRDGPVPAADPQAHALQDACRSITEGLLSSGPSALPVGNYQTFFLLAGDAEQVMVSLTLVRRRGEKTVFRRLTRFSEDRGLARVGYQGDHEGIVVDRFDAHYFAGVNKVGAREPTLTSMRWLPLVEPLLGGRALLMSDRGPAASPAIMRPAPAGSSLRAAMKRLGAVDISSPLVGPLTAQFLRRPYF